MKMVTPRMLGFGSDYRTRRFFIVLPEDWSLSDFLDPEAWGPLVKERRIAVDDIIRVRAFDGSYDTQYRIAQVLSGAAFLEAWPKLPPNFDELNKPRGIICVPLGNDGRPKARAEEIPGLPASDLKRFRVTGIGGDEMSRHSSMKEANAALEYYLEQLQMRLPTEAESEAVRMRVADGELMRRVLGGDDAR